MVTKTLTITEDAYNLLKIHKLPEESFSKEITRILSNKGKKSLKYFFGILGKDHSEEMLNDLARIKKRNITLRKKKIKEYFS